MTTSHHPRNFTKLILSSNQYTVFATKSCAFVTRVFVLLNASDLNACNYDSSANTNDNSCVYPGDIYDLSLIHISEPTRPY